MNTSTTGIVDYLTKANQHHPTAVFVASQRLRCVVNQTSGLDDAYPEFMDAIENMRTHPEKMGGSYQVVIPIVIEAVEEAIQVIDGLNT